MADISENLNDDVRELYEAPELFEFGNAETLTLGVGNKPISDYLSGHYA